MISYENTVNNYYKENNLSIVYDPDGLWIDKIVTVADTIRYQQDAVWWTKFMPY